MAYDLPSGDSDVRLLFGMQIVDDEGAKSEQFSMSVVAKPRNTIAPIVSRVQLFQGTMTNTSKQPCFTRDGREKSESVAMSFVADLRQAALTIGDVPQRNYIIPTDHETAA